MPVPSKSPCPEGHQNTQPRAAVLPFWKSLRAGDPAGRLGEEYDSFDLQVVERFTLSRAWDFRIRFFPGAGHQPDNGREGMNPSAT